MARNSLSALDFIVNVLREHEKELTELSERLENTLTVVTRENVKQALDELSNSLKTLSETMENLSERVGSQVDTDICLGETIEGLQEESLKQRTQINSILDRLEVLPTKNDLEDLRRAIDTLNTLLSTKNLNPVHTIQS